MNNDLFLPLYDKGLNDAQISKILNVSAATVGKLRNSLNLPKRTLIDRFGSEITYLCNQNLTNMEISRILNISSVTILSIRRKLNLQESPWTKSTFNNLEEKIKGKILVRSRCRAKKLGLDFNINQEDILLNEYCPILNIKLDYLFKKQNNINAASLDRIDNTKGYVKGNVIIISVLANTMKNNATTEQLLLFCKNIPNIIENYKPNLS